MSDATIRKHADMTASLDDLPVKLRELAVTIGVRAAGLARFRREEGVDIAYSKSAIADIVTNADRETERLIRDMLAKARPEDGIVGEEFEPSPSRSGINWVVDPIDGTVNYLYGLAPSAVSIAAVRGDPRGDDWSVLAGAVVSLADRQIYSAALGQGAFLDGQRLAAATTTDLPITLVGTGFSYVSETRVRQAGVLVKLLAEVRDIRRMGCASLELCAVAAGKLDLYYERGLKPWDYCAATLVAREAGATVLGRTADQPQEALTIAGNARLVAMLKPKIERWMAEAGL